MVVLLDTTVAAGFVSSLDRKSESVEKSKRWMDCVKLLTAKTEKPFLAIPTPVFYELMARDGKMYSELEEICKNPNSHHPIFQYCNYSITSNILRAASKLRYKTVNKGSMVDSMLGAYCLVNGYKIATTNQKDFPSAFFEVENMALAPLPQKKSERTVVFLLTPKMEEWSAA